MNIFGKSGPKTKDLLDQIDRLKQQINSVKTENQELGKNYFDQFDRNVNGDSTSDFYDGVIDIPSLRSLVEGWDIHIKDLKQYNDLAKRKGVVVSIVGNYGKGKTFLLGLLSDQDTPHGFNVNTKGISIRYLRDKKDNNKIRPVIMLDTKGGSLPLEVSEDGVEDKPREEVNLANMSEKQIEEENRFKQILRDHDATEDVLQNFIMEEANIIIIVVSDLTFPDQRLITKITSKFKENESKKIIVVHNLFHAKAKKDVESKLEEFIFRSFTLKATEFTECEGEKNNKYFVEKGSKGNSLIHHVILAKHGTEAGNFYNDGTIRHIKACIDANGHAKPIDVIESFHRYLKMSLPSYIKTTPELDPNEVKLEKNENQQSMKLKMDKKESFELKAVMTDELGHLRIFKDANEIQPKYCLFEEIVSSTESYLCMKIECPDGLSDTRYRVRHNTDEFSIQIKGAKQKDEKVANTKIADTREHGQLFVETDMYRKSKYRFDYDGIIEKPQRTYIDGMVVLKWRLRPLQVSESLISETRASEQATPLSVISSSSTLKNTLTVSSSLSP